MDKQAVQAPGGPQGGGKALQAARREAFPLASFTLFHYLFTHLPTEKNTCTHQTHVNPIKSIWVQSGSIATDRETLTFTDGVRILPRLVLLAVIFTGPHYGRAAMGGWRLGGGVLGAGWKQMAA